MSGRHLTPDELAQVRAGISLYDALLADLRTLEADGWPSPEDLPDAPLLVDWRLRLMPVHCLHGDVSRHPSVDDGNVQTSPLIAMPNGNRQDVVRTQSRWYRLGTRRRTQ